MRYAVIADAHYHSIKEADHTLASKVDPPFGDGIRYARKLEKELERLKREKESGKIEGVIILGDFFDFLTSEGLKNYWARMQGRRVEEELGLDERKFEEGYRAFLSLLSKVREMNEGGVLIYIRGNHENEDFLDYAGIGWSYDYVVEEKGKKVVFEHGDRFDPLLRIFGFSDGSLAGFLKREIAPKKARKEVANLIRLYGYLLVKSKSFFDRIGLREAELYIASRKVGEVHVIGHTHDDLHVGRILSLGDYLNYGVHYVEIGEEIKVSNRRHSYKIPL